MKYLIALALLSTSCAIRPPKVEKVDIVLKNRTDHTIVIQARAGFFGKKIQLEPGESWKGWIPPQVPVSQIMITLKEGKSSPITRP